MRSLEDILNESAPDTGRGSEPMTAALDDLVEATRDAARSGSRTPVARRRPRRAILAASAATVVLFGGGAAAAVSGSIFGNWDAPWADDPAGTLSFTLPSGGVCEQRIGDLKVANPEANEMVHDWLNHHTLNEIADINAAIATTRAEGPQTWQFDGDTGVRPDVTFGYGTANYDPDYEYVTAMQQATYDAVHTKLLDEGYTDYADYNLSWEGELRCTGDNPYPNIPQFLRESEK
ncbi:hypothetical protein EUA06_13485 [Nocardioides glacieisoli]|uniref:Uncharacterized protein n=1 Tax=Nocardioides glacieisoli TaxID=1168730 RepID=A0A4Q2RMA1_9ACTN|nr:hypothetical protein [Nocardioides glacieisoli]RYB89618.1 hypothetical protein EUA06_13485 [Nocardioides glacieisoli]